MKKSLSRVCMAVYFMVGVVPAQAQPPDAPQAEEAEVETDERAEARELYAQGAAAFEAGDFAEALAKFEACYEVSRLSALLFNIGSSHDRLHQPQQALRHYRAYLAAVPEAENRQYVESRIILLEAEVDESEPVAPPTVEPGPSEDPAPVLPPPPPTAPSRAGPIVLLAAGGAAAGGAIVTGILARGSRGDLDDACNGTICPPEARSTHDAMKRQALLTDILGGVALGLVAAGVLWWVLQPGDEDQDEARVEFGCSIQGCNAQVQW